MPVIAERYPEWAAAWAPSEYLTIHGSHAYGLATEDSDIDLTGSYVPLVSALLGYRDPPAEQMEFSPQTSTPARLAGPHDTAIYSIQELCRLGAACNPNLVEMLFVDQRHVLEATPLGERIRELGPRFLSLRARQAFGDHARGQLRRMDQHRRWLMHPPTDPSNADCVWSSGTRVGTPGATTSLLCAARHFQASASRQDTPRPSCARGRLVGQRR